MPKLIGLDWDAETAWEIRNKGWYELAKLQLDDGSLIPLSFRDPIRLGQELQAHFASGKSDFALQNLIILPELNERAMRPAATELSSRGFLRKQWPLDAKSAASDVSPPIGKPPILK
jgi:hypothetical protein